MNYFISLITLFILGFTDQVNNFPADDKYAVNQQKPVQMEPVVLYHFEEMPRLLTLPDGRLIATFIRHKGPGLPAAKDFQDVRARYSEDNGKSWGPEVVLFRLPRKRVDLDTMSVL
jgi:hypothetical protein